MPVLLYAAKESVDIWKQKPEVAPLLVAAADLSTDHIQNLQLQVLKDGAGKVTTFKIIVMDEHHLRGIDFHNLCGEGLVHCISTKALSSFSQMNQFVGRSIRGGTECRATVLAVSLLN